MATDIRDELRKLGAEREAIVRAETELAPRIENALARATAEHVPVTEQASLLGLHRTTLYRVYRPRTAA